MLTDQIMAGNLPGKACSEPRGRTAPDRREEIDKVGIEDGARRDAYDPRKERSDGLSQVVAKISRLLPEIGYNASTPDFMSMFHAPESDRPPDFGPRFAARFAVKK